MKCFRRCCCVFLCCVSLLIAFSGVVSAKPVDVPVYSITAYHTTTYGGKSYSNMVNFTPRNGTLESVGGHYTGNITSSNNQTISVNLTHHIWVLDEGILIKAGDSTQFTYKTIQTQTMVWYSNSNHFYSNGYNTRLLLYYADGTKEYFDATMDTGIVTATFTPKKNVESLEVIMQRNISISNGLTFSVGATMGEYSGDDTHIILLDQTSEEVGLLGGIKEGINNLFNSIAELPSKIANFIIDGIKSLFVPTQEDITTFFDSLNNLLEERLGAVYQVTYIMFESWDRITANDQNNTINIPSATIPLPEGNSFTFGGYDVSIVPEGFDWLATTIKTLVGIVCTLLFVNGMRKKYDEVMGVEQ